MAYRINYFPKDRDKRLRTHGVRLPILTVLFFLLFCMYTRQCNPEHIMYLKPLLLRFREVFTELLETALA